MKIIYLKTGLLTLVLILVLISGTTSGQDSNATRVKKSAKQYDVAAIIWPSYHPDDRAKIFWPDGIGEWQTVMSNKPKFKGHQQPRYPLWGYINEADPYVAEMEISAAADHGINVFIFDWYWYDGMPFLEGQLNDGYLKARNNDRVKFYLMWANHDVTLGWDKRNADDAFTKKNKEMVWKGEVDREEFEKIALRWIDKYFKHSSYYKIDGKPVLMIYQLDDFINGLGGVEKAKEAIDWFRKEVKKAGFKDLELQYAMKQGGGAISVEGRQVGTPKELIEKLGFNSLTHYVYAHMTRVDRDYNEITEDAVKIWNNISNEYSAKYYPQVSVGWDASPRTYNYTGAITTNNTPENFESALRKAKEFVDAHPDRAPLITVNSWNEWTETSYLMPCTMFGYGYLKAVKKVFGDNK
jgi:hypothetical protein